MSTEGLKLFRAEALEHQRQLMEAATQELTQARSQLAAKDQDLQRITTTLSVLERHVASANEETARRAEELKGLTARTAEPSQALESQRQRAAVLVL